MKKFKSKRKKLRNNMKYGKGDIVQYRGQKAKVIGVSVKSGEIMYKLRLYGAFDTVVYNIYEKEISKFK
jgi:hypothetical protein